MFDVCLPTTSLPRSPSYCTVEYYVVNCLDREALGKKECKAHTVLGPVLKRQLAIQFEAATRRIGCQATPLSTE